MSKKNRRAKRYEYSNQHAAIQVKPNYESEIGGLTFTANREDQFQASIVTDSSNSSSLGVLVGTSTFSLSGRQARTLQRLLNKHYSTVGRSQAVLGVEAF